MKGVPGAARTGNVAMKIDGPIKIGVNDHNRPRTQAYRIFVKFGGVPGLWEALKTVQRPRQLQAMYRWLYPKERGGSDGLVPLNAMEDILIAARYMGIILSSEDLDPRAIPIDTTVKKLKNNVKHDL